MRPARLLASAIAVIGLSALVGPWTALPAGASGTTTTLGGEMLGNLNLARQTGVASPGQRMAIGIALANRDQAGENAYVAAEYNPASQLYHHFLSPAEFNARFAPTAATLAGTQRWLSGAGLTVTTVPGSTSYLEASGTVAQVEALTNVRLANFDFKGHLFYANTSAPTVPSALGILGIIGLNDFTHFQAYNTTPAHSSSAAAPAANVPVTGQLTPQALWSIYDQPSNNFGEGQTMAVFGWTASGDGQGHDTTGTTTVSDLRAAEQHWNFPQTPIQYNLYGDTTTADSDQSAAQGEWDLDTQASTDMSPNVQGEKLYFAHHNSDADILAAFTAWVGDPSGPLQGSASFGECENIPQAGRSSAPT